MSSVTYHGEYPPEQDFIEQYGYVFERGKSVNVSKEHAEKLATNRFFKVAGKSDKEDVEQGQDEAENAESDTLKVYLTDQGVPFRKNANLSALRDLKEDHEKALAAAQED